MINDRISKLREILIKKSIDAYIIPSSDDHQSEYVGEYFKSRQWISGFTGSAGTVVVTRDSSELWADGRYHIQAANQIKGTEINLHKLGLQGVKNHVEWLKDTLKDGSKVSFNSKVISVSAFKDMQNKFKSKNIELIPAEDFIEKIWLDRPNKPFSKVFILEEKYAGETRVDKIKRVREEMKKKGSSSYVISCLDDIAWLLNIRAHDVSNYPVVISYFMIKEDSNILYIDRNKLTKEIEEELLRDGIIVKDYEEVLDDVKTIKNQTVFIDPAKTNVWIYNAIDSSNNIVEKRNITTYMKAVKSEVELQNYENCQLKDGVAMVKFMKWLKDNIGKEYIDELSAAEKLENFRKEQDLFIETSFTSISAYKANAAMMHYAPTKENKAVLEPRGMYLIDSGGQYFDGTTDITRTIALGSLSQEERKDFTLVLKGHIGLSQAKFLYGTTGSNLDILARKPMWDNGIDYKCGTGHGVGFLLSVHEGPHSISTVPNTVKLEEGMVVTNEPGIYKEGKHGIRTENVLVVKEFMTTEHGRFMKFEPITYCPIDIDAIDKEFLTDTEKTWLNEYHKLVYDKLSSNLDDETREWLQKYTKEI